MRPWEHDGPRTQSSVPPTNPVEAPDPSLGPHIASKTCKGTPRCPLRKVRPVMICSTDELERPAEWLRRFADGAPAYRALLEESGSLAVAAHRLACARCRIQPMAFSVPTLSELRSAVDDIASGAGLPRVDHIGVIVADCALEGLPVILPPSYDSAA